MKKVLLFSILSYFTVLTAFAQSLELSNAYGKMNDGDTIVLFNTNATASFAVGVTVKNTSGSDIDVKVKKTELSLISGSENYFCWVSCYLANTYVSPTGITLKPGRDTSVFTGDYNSMGNAGASYIRYTFFDSKTPSDSITFVAKYIAGSGVGIENTQAKAQVSNIYPNPARNTVSLNYDLNGAQHAQFEIYNILGSLVKTIEIDETSGLLNIDVTDLNNGVYFYSFIVNDKVITSKKLVIQR